MKCSPQRLLGRALRAATLVLWASSTAVLAQDQPVVVGEQRKLPPFGHTPVFGSLNFVSQYSRDEVDVKQGNDSKTTELRLEESISLQTSAYFIHPNFLHLNLAGEFGLTQDEFKDNDQDERTNSQLYLWNIEALFLRENPTSFMAYTNRTENIIDRAFANSFRTTYTTYGALLSHRTQRTFSTFRLYRTEQEQQSLGGDDDFTLNDNVFEWHTEANLTPNQFLTWDYRIDQSEQSTTGGIDDNSLSQSASLAHTLAFGPSNSHTLGSTIAYSTSTGNFGVDRFYWDELLRLRHTPNFETEYEYRIDQQQSDTIDQTLQRATAEFWHHLYQSLLTHGQVGYLQLDTGGGGQTKDLFSEIDFQYVKKVPFGRLDGSMNLGYNYRTTDSNSQTVGIVDQSFTFVGFQPIFIPGQTVDPNSIVVTDSTGRIFTPGMDYTLDTSRPDGVLVNRVVGGAIPSDTSVLVDYSLGPIPETTFQTGAFAVSLRYDILEGVLKGLSPYARFAAIEQSVSGGGGLVQPDSIRDYVVGAEYRIGDLTLMSEYEWYDSTLVPYNALRASARYDHRVSFDTIVSANVSYVGTDYTQLDQQTDTYNANAAITHLLNRQLLFTATVGWVDIDDSIAGHTQGFQQSLELRWRNRQLEVYGRVRNSTLDSDDQDNSFQFFEVGISREF